MTKLANLKQIGEHTVDHKVTHKDLGRITFSGQDSQAIHSRSPWIENVSGLIVILEKINANDKV